MWILYYNCYVTVTKAQELQHSPAPSKFLTTIITTINRWRNCQNSGPGIMVPMIFKQHYRANQSNTTEWVTPVFAAHGSFPFIRNSRDEDMCHATITAEFSELLRQLYTQHWKPYYTGKSTPFSGFHSQK